MTKEEFEHFYWAYFLFLEQKFNATTAYVSLNRANFGAYSFEYMHLLLAICSAFENSIKVFPGDTDKNWTRIKFFLKNNFHDTQPIVTMPDYPEIELHPFPQVSDDAKLDIPWWNAYNDSKHNWTGNLAYANLENVINSLAGFFVVCMIFIKNASTSLPDIPMKPSSLFLLKNVTFKSFLLNNMFARTV